MPEIGGDPFEFRQVVLPAGSGDTIVAGVLPERTTDGGKRRLRLTPFGGKRSGFQARRPDGGGIAMLGVMGEGRAHDWAPKLAEAKRASNALERRCSLDAD